LIKNEPNKLLTYIKKADTLIKPEYNTIVVPRAAEYSVKLSDGTIVYLNSDSKLRYPVPFEKGVRKVYLEGEAYFKVSKDKRRPFIVDVKEVEVKVLGTSFNINAYEENNGVATTLVEGSVNVSSANNSVIIKPNQQAVFSKGGSMKVNNVNVYNYISWRQGYLNFDNVPLEQLMFEIERWFDINVFYVNSELKTYRYTGAINKYYSLDKMLHIVEEVLKIKIRKKDKNVFIEKSSV
jgi:ferric-dicitrate binding protein FerR (iron transport regulator)